MHLPNRDDLDFVTVSDEADDGPTMFHGLRLGPEPQGDDTVPVAVFVTKNSGFGWPAMQMAIQPLKHLGNGRYGA